MIEALVEPSFALSLAVLLSASEDSGLAELVGERWRLARKEINETEWLLDHRRALEGAVDKPWSRIQPLLISPWAKDLLQFHSVRQIYREPQIWQDVEFCRREASPGRGRSWIRRR